MMCYRFAVGKGRCLPSQNTADGGRPPWQWTKYRTKKSYVKTAGFRGLIYCDGDEKTGLKRKRKKGLE